MLFGTLQKAALVFQRVGLLTTNRDKGEFLPYRGSVLEFRISRHPAEHPSAGRLATDVNADGKEQHVAYTPRVSGVSQKI